MSKTKIAALLVAIVGTALYFSDVFKHSHDWDWQVSQAMSAYKKKDFPGAERFLKAAIAQAEGFQKQDPRLHLTLNNLLEIYRVQLKFAEAEPIILRVLAMDEQSLGPDHPNVGASLNALADNYFAQGKYAEAVKVYPRVLAIWEKLLGPNHSLVRHILKNNAETLRKLGRLDEAEEMETRINRMSPSGESEKDSKPQ